MIKLSFVIPVYNSQYTLAELVRRIESTVAGFPQQHLFEVILVNDGSKDDSDTVCKNLCKQYGFVKYISLSRNFGQPHAIIAGFKFVTGDYVICLDDDLQTPPEEAPKLIETLVAGNYDVVYGKYESKKHSGFRNLGSIANQMMARWLINKPSHIATASFFVARRFIIDELLKYDGVYPHIPGLIFRITQNIGNVLVVHHPRKIGRSNYTLKKLISLWFYGFTNFSVKPLRLSIFFGFFLAVFSFIFIMVLIIQKMALPQRQIGWTSIMVLITFFGGIQLISIGLVGEYVGRMFMCINRSPQYVIKEVVQGADWTHE